VLEGIGGGYTIINATDAPSAGGPIDHTTWIGGLRDSDPWFMDASKPWSLPRWCGASHVAA